MLHLDRDSQCYDQHLWLLEEQSLLGRVIQVPTGLMCQYDPAHGGSELLMIRPAHYNRLLCGLFSAQIRSADQQPVS